MAIAFFEISGRSLMQADWGDYGDILQHGMTAHLPRLGGRLALERTGPYIPPITLPGIGDIVLTAEARARLEASGLTGFSFEPVEKALIVELHWEDWDRDAEEPPEFPETGEPEDYILGRPHSPVAAMSIGDLWEVVVRPTVTVLRSKSNVTFDDDLRIDVSAWNGDDLIRSEGYGSILFSERARNWFTEEWGTYVQFVHFPTA
jgi:hypothetical protein